MTMDLRLLSTVEPRAVNPVVDMHLRNLSSQVIRRRNISGIKQLQILLFILAAQIAGSQTASLAPFRGRVQTAFSALNRGKIPPLSETIFAFYFILLFYIIFLFIKLSP